MFVSLGQRNRFMLFNHILTKWNNLLKLYSSPPQSCMQSQTSRVNVNRHPWPVSVDFVFHPLDIYGRNCVAEENSQILEIQHYRYRKKVQCALLVCEFNLITLIWHADQISNRCEWCCYWQTIFKWFLRSFLVESWLTGSKSGEFQRIPLSNCRILRKESKTAHIQFVFMVIPINPVVVPKAPKLFIRGLYHSGWFFDAEQISDGKMILKGDNQKWLFIVILGNALMGTNVYKL